MEFNGEVISMADDLKLNILVGRFAKCDPNWFAKDVISPYSRIYYVTGGTAVLTYGDKKCILEPGYLYFIPMGLRFDYECDDSLEKYFFHVNLFSGDYIDVFSTCKEIISFETNREQVLQKIFARNDMVSSLLLKSCIYEDLYTIATMAGIKSMQKQKQSEVINRALLYINSHLSIKLRVKEIAKNLYISPSTLSKRFYNEMGFSIGHYIDLRIQFEAEKLLSDGELSIEQISEKLGFCDRFYFARKFKETMNITPAKYRANAKSIQQKL